MKSSQLERYAYIHIATHGVLAQDLPNLLEPALILSGESGQDALLTASEAQKLNLNATVAVLSACSTGSGQIVGGEGVMGMSRAFLLAGAEAVVVSL